MTFEDAKQYLDSFETKGIKLGLQRTRVLLDKLGKPQNALNIVHVAGTNGKGSTCKYIQSILMQAGYRVGLYTSPHLVDITERINIGQDISRQDFADIICTIKSILQKHQLCDHITQFEILTAAALLYFWGKTDWVVLETGLGGTYDATNVVVPRLSVITHISFDHMHILGNDIASIASNKAGIIKNGVPVVVAPQYHQESYVVLDRVAEQKNCEVVKVDTGQVCCQRKEYKGVPLQPSLLGRHQIENAATAVDSIIMLNRMYNTNVTPRHIQDGIKNTLWPCRIERVSNNPAVYIDGAHNVDGLQRLVEYIVSTYPSSKIVAVFGVMQDKEYDVFVQMIQPIVDIVYTVSPNSSRALSSQQLAECLHESGIDAIACKSVSQAIQLAMAHNNIVVVFGSLYLAGEAKTYLTIGERLG